MKDGETTVIGGIYTRQTSNRRAEVPFLGKIPLLGALFRQLERAGRPHRAPHLHHAPHPEPPGDDGRRGDELGVRHEDESPPPRASPRARPAGVPGQPRVGPDPGDLRAADDDDCTFGDDVRRAVASASRSVDVGRRRTALRSSLQVENQLVEQREPGLGQHEHERRPRRRGRSIEYDGRVPERVVLEANASVPAGVPASVISVTSMSPAERPAAIAAPGIAAVRAGRDRRQGEAARVLRRRQRASRRTSSRSRSRSAARACVRPRAPAPRESRCRSLPGPRPVARVASSATCAARLGLDAPRPASILDARERGRAKYEPVPRAHARK